MANQWCAKFILQNNVLNMVIPSLLRGIKTNAPHVPILGVQMRTNHAPKAPGQRCSGRPQKGPYDGLQNQPGCLGTALNGKQQPSGSGQSCACCVSAQHGVRPPARQWRRYFWALGEAEGRKGRYAWSVPSNTGVENSSFSEPTVTEIGTLEPGMSLTEERRSGLVSKPSSS